MGTLQLLKKHIEQGGNWANQLTAESLSYREKQSAYYRLCKPIKTGEVMVLAGRPSMGAGILALNLVVAFGIKRQIPVTYFNLNKGAARVVDNLIAMCSGINTCHIRLQQLDPRQYERYFSTIDKLNAAPIVMDDAPHTVESLRKAFLSAQKMLSEVSDVQQRNGSLLVIDAAQFIQPSLALDLDNKTMMAHLSLSLKQLAQEFNVAVVLVAGVIRAVEERNCKRPKVTDVENWSELKAGVDTVALLYRDGIYYPGQTDTSLVEVTLSSADTKTLDKTMLRFDADCLRFNLDMF